MAWRIEYTSTAVKQLSKLDKPAAKRLLDFMDERIAVAEGPRQVGKALVGAKLGSYWRYRVGDYRLICDIQDNVLCVVVVQVGSRSKVYVSR